MPSDAPAEKRFGSGAGRMTCTKFGKSGTSGIYARKIHQRSLIATGEGSLFVGERQHPPFRAGGVISQVLGQIGYVVAILYSQV